MDSDEKLVQKIYHQVEYSIMRQLNWLVSRGMLELKSGPIKFTFNEESKEVELNREVEITLKDKEYIEKIEYENKLLKNTIRDLRNLINRYVKDNEQNVSER